MKRIAAQSLLFALLFLSCRNQAGNDEEALKRVLLDYFDGIKRGDREKMRAVTTEEFLIYEAGEIMNNDSVFTEMERISPYRADFKFEHFRVDFGGKLGHMSYYEHATFIVNDTVTVWLHFTGSAAFTRIGSAWKMHFMHATRADSLTLVE